MIVPGFRKSYLKNTDEGIKNILWKNKSVGVGHTKRKKLNYFQIR